MSVLRSLHGQHSFCLSFVVHSLGMPRPEQQNTIEKDYCGLLKLESISTGKYIGGRVVSSPEPPSAADIFCLFVY